MSTATKPVGWRQQPARHSLAAKGVKTRPTRTPQQQWQRAFDAMDKPPRWMSIEEVKAANEEAGKHFFDEDTLRFFDSKIESNAWVIGGAAYFITSEQFHNGDYHAPRGYTVRKMNLKTGGVDSVTEFNKLDEKEAKAAFEDIRKKGE